jgi:small subunit ribosomal protein S1
MSVSFKEFLATDPKEEKLRVGDMVNATVVHINTEKRLILVDGGILFKSESIIPMSEFSDDNHLLVADGSIHQSDEVWQTKPRPLEIEVGSEVPVVIEALDNGYGETVLSRDKAKRGLAWATLQEALENKTTVQGVVTGKVRGGFTVDLGILKGFLPGSLVDAQYLDEINALTAKRLDFRVITLDYQRNNIVLSQGQVNREALLSNLQEGQIIKGYVKNLADYGAFINLGGIDGLLHNSDISWEKTTAREYFKSKDPKEAIEVMILKIDQSKSRPRISLGLKQLSEDPWTHVADHYAVGMRLEKCRVTHIKEYGCFVEIAPGVEGLVHVSQMDWTNRNPNPHTVIQRVQDKDGKIAVVILEIDINLAENKRRLSLGIKQCMENPWVAFSERNQEGDHIQGVIRSITDLGLFIHLEGNIDGLVHHSEVGPDYSAESAARQFKKGDTIEVVVLSIDPAKERVALSVRQISKAYKSPERERDKGIERSTFNEVTLDKPNLQQMHETMEASDFDIPPEQTKIDDVSSTDPAEQTDSEFDFMTSDESDHDAEEGELEYDEEAAQE